MDLEIGLGMCTGGADLGSLGADHDVATVAALPYLDVALAEHLLGLYIVQQGAVALLMTLLDGSYETELGSELGEALLIGGAGKAFVHVGPLVVFALSGCCQVVGGGGDAIELLEPELGVLLLIISRLLEDGGYLLKSVLLGARGEVGVFVACLRFACECGLEILLGLCASVFVCHSCDCFGS